MTPQQLALISESAELVAAAPRPFAERFYGHLFETRPEVRMLFPDDMDQLFVKLVDELAFLSGAAADLDTFVIRAAELGRRHRRYGVSVDHFEPVEQALLHALSTSLPDVWTDRHEGAWRSLYRLIAEVMLDGASTSLFN